MYMGQGSILWSGSSLIPASSFPCWRAGASQPGDVSGQFFYVRTYIQTYHNVYISSNLTDSHFTHSVYGTSQRSTFVASFLRATFDPVAYEFKGHASTSRVGESLGTRLRSTFTDRFAKRQPRVQCNVHRRVC